MGHRVSSGGSGNKLTVRRKGAYVSTVTPTFKKTRRYYVNLKENPKASSGRSLEVVVQVKGFKKGEEVRVYPVIETNRVVPKSNPELGELSNSGSNARLSADDVKYDTNTDMSNVLQSAKADAKGKVVFTLRLSTFGGDLIRAGFSTVEADRDAYVEAETKDTRAEAGKKLMWTGTFEVWRKLWVQVDCMKRPGKSGTYQDLFSAVGSDWLKQYEKCFVTVAPAVKGWGVTLPFSTGTSRKYDDLVPYAKKYRRGKHDDKLYIHMLFVDTLVKTDDKPVSMPIMVAGLDKNLSARVPLGKRAIGWIDPKDPIDKNALGWNVPGKDLSKVEVTPGIDGDSMYIDVKVKGVKLDPGVHKTVYLNLIVKLWPIGNGMSTDGGRVTIMGMHWREETFPTTAVVRKSTLRTLVHEIGHAMGLAAFDMPDGFDLFNVGGEKGYEPLQKWTYQYNGAHCWNTYDEAKGVGCAMWDSNYWHPGGSKSKFAITTEFCPICQVNLRARVLRLPFVYERRGKRVTDRGGFGADGYDPDRNAL